MKVGDKLPSIELDATSQQSINLAKIKNKHVIVYFYPKDMTPGCTGEAKDFSALKEDFEKLGIHIVGVSPDSIESHLKFVEKEVLAFQIHKQ